MKNKRRDGQKADDLMQHPGHLLRRAVQVMNLLWAEEVSHTITSPQFATGPDAQTMTFLHSR